MNPSGNDPSETVYSNGVYCLINHNGDRIMMPINGKFIKKYGI